jgi:hypothetical protein
MITQAGTGNARNFRQRRWRIGALRGAIGTKADERVARKVRIAFAELPDQLQEQRQRPRRAFMLQRTIVR